MLLEKQIKDPADLFSSLAVAKNTDALKLMIKKYGEDKKYIDDFLISAVISGNSEVFSQLLETSVLTNNPSMFEHCLWDIIEYNNLTMLKKFLEHGGELHVGKNGETPFQYALKNHNTALLDVLIKYSTNKNDQKALLEYTQ